MLCALALFVSCAAVGFAEEAPEETPEELNETFEENGAGPVTDDPEDDPEEESGEMTGMVVEDVELPETIPGEEPEQQEEEKTEEPAPVSEKPENEEVISDPVTIQDAVEEAAEEKKDEQPAAEEKPAEPAPAVPEQNEEEKQEPAENNEEEETDQPEDKPEKKPENKPEEEPDEPEGEAEEAIYMDLDVMNTVSGILTRGKSFALIAADAYSRTVIFTLTVSEEDAVSAVLNEKPVTLEKVENTNPASTDVIYTFEKQLLQNQVYSISLTTEKEGYVPFTLTLTEKQEAATAETPEASEKTPEKEEKATKTDSGLREEEAAAKEERSELPENRNAIITISWDDENPGYGSVAHFHAELIGYEGTEYTLQWQWSTDGNSWMDVDNATDVNMDITYSIENEEYRWRIVVDVTA